MARIIAVFAVTKTYRPVPSGNHRTTHQQMTAALMDYLPRLIDELNDPFLERSGITSDDVYICQRYAWRSEVTGEGLLLRIRVRGRPPADEAVKKTLVRSMSDAVHEWARQRHTSPTP